MLSSLPASTELVFTLLPIVVECKTKLFIMWDTYMCICAWRPKNCSVSVTSAMLALVATNIPSLVQWGWCCHRFVIPGTRHLSILRETEDIYYTLIPTWRLGSVAPIGYDSLTIKHHYSHAILSMLRDCLLQTALTYTRHNKVKICVV